MRRGQQVTRQWKILMALAARGGVSVPELMRELSASRRTVWRDLQVLQEVGFPVTNERDGRESRYRLIEGTRGLPPVPVSLPELWALHMARDLLKPLRGTPLGEPIQSVLAKVAAQLSPSAKAFLDKLARLVSARTTQAKALGRSRDTLEILRTAAQDQCVVEADYHSFGRNVLTHRRLNPLHLWYQQGGVYLAAYCHQRKEVRTFAVERFRTLHRTPEHFDPPVGFDLERYLAGGFGLFRGKPVQVRLRFSREVARYLAERDWHPTQVLEPLLSGELEVTLTAPVCPELTRWILGYGKDVEVVEPKALREAIRGEWLAALRGAGGRVAAPAMKQRRRAVPYPTPLAPALAAAEGGGSTLRASPVRNRKSAPGHSQRVPR